MLPLFRSVSEANRLGPRFDPLTDRYWTLISVWKVKIGPWRVNNRPVYYYSVRSTFGQRLRGNFVFSSHLWIVYDKSPQLCVPCPLAASLAGCIAPDATELTRSNAVQIEQNHGARSTSQGELSDDKHWFIASVGSVEQHKKTDNFYVPKKNEDPVQEAPTFIGNLLDVLADHGSQIVHTHIIPTRRTYKTYNTISVSVRCFAHLRWSTAWPFPLPSAVTGSRTPSHVIVAFVVRAILARLLLVYYFLVPVRVGMMRSRSDNYIINQHIISEPLKWASIPVANSCNLQ